MAQPDLSLIFKGVDVFGRGLYRENLSNIGTRIFGGRMGTIDNTTPNTYQVSTAVAQHFDSIRVIFANTSPSLAVTGIVAKASVVSSTADLNNSSGTWVDVFQNNNPAFNISNSPGTNRIRYSLSDPVPLKSIARTDGGTFPIVIIRMTCGSSPILPCYGQGSAPDIYTNWANKPSGRFWIARQQVGNHVTTTTGFTSTTNTNQSPIVGIQYLSRGHVVSVMCIGNSISDGISEYRGEGFGMPVCEQLSDMNNIAIEYSNCGWSGQSTAAYSKRAIDILNSEIKPDILLFPTGSPNDISTTITPAIIQDQAGRVSSVVAECKRTGVRIVLWTWLPTDTVIKNYGATDSLRVSENLRYLSMTNQGYLVADTSSLMTGLQVNGQYQLLDGVSDDHIHPNNNGNAIMGEPFKPILKHLIGI